MQCPFVRRRPTTWSRTSRRSTLLAAEGPCPPVGMHQRGPFTGTIHRVCTPGVRSEGMEDTNEDFLATMDCPKTFALLKYCRETAHLCSIMNAVWLRCIITNNRGPND